MAMENAVLLRDVEFLTFDDEEVMLPRGFQVSVDREAGIAYAACYHFDVMPEEYEIVD